MPRKTRFTLFYSCHHVMLRGNAGRLIYIDDEDRIRFCLILQKASEEHHFAIHAFCFMNNHMHLILEPTTISLSVGVKAFAERYAQYFNRRHKQKGHLFQDRFRSIVIEDGDYLIRLTRYIHLNPVRANLTTTPQHYHWSSYCVYLGLHNIAWLTQTRILRKFGNSDLEARQAIVKYTSTKADAEFDISIVRESNLIGALGCEDFVKEITDLNFPSTVAKIQFNDIVTAAKTEFQFNINEIISTSREKRLVDMRSILALAVQKTPGLYLQEAAQFLNRDSSSLGRLVKRARQSSDLSQCTDRLLASVISKKTVEKQ